MNAINDKSILILAGWYACASLACFIAYAVDKRAARAGRRRTPERTLLLLGLIGGWPGGLLAQRIVRHKSSKAAFLVKFRVTAIVNVVLLAAVVYVEASTGACALVSDIFSRSEKVSDTGVR